jgi:glycosyltransferase involved in cell wall biosynthesis
MPFRVGIGIITFNRKDLVDSTIARVRALTRESDAALVIADDGSSDGTLEMLRDKGVPMITGINMGIAWNKNRALFLLSHLLGCSTVILLEDDTQPASAGWEAPWVLAAQRWGHVNYAGDWMREYFVSGSGTPGDPVESTMVTAQCAAYSHAALTYAGYFDPRFKGYGHEHVEHSRRLIRLGFGGSDGEHDGKERVLYKMIAGGVTVLPAKSHFDPAVNERNLLLARQIIGRQDYRMPWGNDRELRQFRSEMESAMRDGPARFVLHGDEARDFASAPSRYGLLNRLLRSSHGGRMI